MKKSIVSLLAFVLFCGLTFAQQSEVQQTLQQSIQSRYRVTQLGPSLLGVKGNQDTIRKTGGIVLIVKPGLFGALDRGDITSNAITDGKRTHLAGKEEVKLAPGDRFYVNSVRVGPDFITVGLLSVEEHPSTEHPDGRVWSAINFFFKPDVIKSGDLNAINATMDQWIAPSGGQLTTPSVVAKAISIPALPSAVELTPGMTKDDVVSKLGNPTQSITFENHVWLTYPALVAVLEDGKLKSVDPVQQTTGILAFNSDATGSQIYVDDELAGETPTNLLVPVGSHKVELRSEGKSSWQEQVRVFPGATIPVKPGSTATGK